MLGIALPAVLTMSSITAMQFVDKLFVKELGPDALAAVGNGWIAAFSLMSIAIGALGIINTYVSQNLGAGTPERAPAYAWNGLWLVGIIWLLALLPFAAVLPDVMHQLRALAGLESVTPEVASMESGYARILLVGSLFTIGGRSLHGFFYGMHKPVIVAAAVGVGQVVNIALTYLLVFGHFGFPQWGVAGSAVGTVVGAFCEFAIPLAVFLSPKLNAQFRTRAAWRFSTKHVRDIWKLGWPGGVQFGNEMVCWWIFMAGFAAKFGTAANAASWITLQYMHLSFMPAVGISIALQAIVGKCVGAKRDDLAIQRTWLGMKVSMVYMGACALAFVIFREGLINVFRADSWSSEESEAVLRYGSQLLILAAVFQVFDGMGMSLIGSLRGAGDTIFPGVATMILAWTVIIGLGWGLTHYAESWGPLGPWIAAALYIILLGIALMWRFLSGGWKGRGVVHDEETPAPVPAAG